MSTITKSLVVVFTLICCLVSTAAWAETWPTLEDYVKKCVLIVKCRTDARDVGRHEVLETWKGNYSPDLFVAPPREGFIIADDAHGNTNPVGGREVIFFYTLHNQPESGKLQSHSAAFPIANGKLVYASTDENRRKEYTVDDFRLAVIRITFRQKLIDEGRAENEVVNMSDDDLIQEMIKRMPRPPTEKWTLAELSKQADTIVIARQISSTEFPFDAGKFPLQSNDEDFRRYTRSSVIGVMSKLSVLAVLRGEVKGDELEIVHLKHGPNVVNLSDIRFAEFENEVVVPQTVSLVLKGQPRSVSSTPIQQTVIPIYLLFLTRRDDGRFEAASGQLHSAYSVRTVEGGLESWSVAGAKLPLPAR